MNLEFKTIDITTKEGRMEMLDLRQDPQWKLVSSSFMSCEMLFEKVDKWIDDDELVSNCCSAKVWEETDVCSKCNEHCKIIKI